MLSDLIDQQFRHYVDSLVLYMPRSWVDPRWLGHQGVQGNLVS